MKESIQRGGRQGGGLEGAGEGVGFRELRRREERGSGRLRRGSGVGERAKNVAN